MKFFKLHWFKVVVGILIAGLAFYVLTFAIWQAHKIDIYSEQQQETRIYTIWHIETFEGGGKTRIDYLKTIARELEKQNASVLFMFENVDPQTLHEKLSLSTTPDIISFGFGVGDVLLEKLVPLASSYNVRDELVASGMFNSKIYALPYIVSGYAMLSHSAKSNLFLCGTTQFTHPENIYTHLNLTPSKEQTQYEAYKDFVYNKSATLLGTARDVYRVQNLNNIGRTNAQIQPISSFTDLIQYLGITRVDDIILKFISACLSYKNQQNLANYSLFSALYNKLYTSGIYCDMEQAIFACDIARLF